MQKLLSSYLEARLVLFYRSKEVPIDQTWPALPKGLISELSCIDNTIQHSAAADDMPNPPASDCEASLSRRLLRGMLGVWPQSINIQ